MTAPAISGLVGPGVAYCRPVARLSAEPVPLPACAAQPRAGHNLARLREWPLRSYRELRGLPVSVRFARMHATKVLCAWGMGSMADTVELLVSEITTNAVRASADQQTRSGLPLRTRRLRFWLTSDRRNVLIQVWDGDYHSPVRRSQELDAEGGRGLVLVEALSAQWGCYAADGLDALGGKIVWALCTE